MPLALPVVTASPDTVTFGADPTEYRVGPLSYYDLGRLQRIVDRLAVGPLEAAAPILAKLPEGSPERADLYRKAAAAQGRWSPPDVGTPDGNDVLLGTIEARRDFLAVGLEAFNPDVTPEAIDRLHRILPIDTFIALRNIWMEQPRDPKGHGEPDTPESSPDTSTDSDREEQAARAESLLGLLEAWRVARSPFRWITAGSSTAIGSG